MRIYRARQVEFKARWAAFVARKPCRKLKQTENEIEKRHDWGSRLIPILRFTHVQVGHVLLQITIKVSCI